MGISEARLNLYRIILFFIFLFFFCFFFFIEFIVIDLSVEYQTNRKRTEALIANIRRTSIHKCSIYIYINVGLSFFVVVLLRTLKTGSGFTVFLY